MAPPKKTLTAPSRSLAAASGGGKRNLLILLLLVIVAGGAGGYFFLMGDGEDFNAPVHVTAPAPVSPVADAPPQPVPADTLAAATPAPAGDLPQPAPAGTDPLAAPVPAAGTDSLAAPTGTDPLSAPPADPASPDMPAMPADAAVLGAPPADEATALTPAPANTDPLAATAPVQPAPDEMAPEMPPATASAVPGQPAGDLPLPEGGVDAAPGTSVTAAPAATGIDTTAAAPAAAETAVPAPPSEAAPSWAAPGTAAVPGTTNPAIKPSSPNDAELAIVQNAAVLDQLSRPATGAAASPAAPTGMPFDPNAPKPSATDALKAIQQNIEVTAVRRVMPPSYMTIKRESDAGDVDSRLVAARSALAQGRSAAALELFEDLKKDFPKDKRILMGRAVSLQKLGQEEEALAAYEAVLNRDPKNLDALTNMLGLLKSRDPGLAVEKLQELRDAYPYQGDITAQLGIAYAANGQYEPALKYLDMADSLKPGSSYVLYNKAVLLDKMGQGGKAALLYRRILRMAADGELDQPLPLDVIRNRIAVLR